MIWGKLFSLAGLQVPTLLQRVVIKPKQNESKTAQNFLYWLSRTFLLQTRTFIGINPLQLRGKKRSFYFYVLCYLVNNPGFPQMFIGLVQQCMHKTVRLDCASRHLQKPGVSVHSGLCHKKVTVQLYRALCENVFPSALICGQCIFF